MDLEKLAVELRRRLAEDILERYDSPEYWDQDLIDEFIHECGLSEEEADKLRDLIRNT